MGVRPARHDRADEARRVLIDSLGDLRATVPDEIRFREYIYSLLQRTSRAKVSVVMTQELPELFGATRLSEYGISHVSDNVVMLQFLLEDSRLRRSILVLKSRASAPDPRMRDFRISPEGISIGQPVGYAEMGLARVPSIEPAGS